MTYWSPDWNGFTASWGWGEDDIWGAALRYRHDWGNLFQVDAGVGYEHFRDERFNNAGGGLAGLSEDADEWAGSASIKHKPTGLFAFTAFSFSDDNSTNRQNAGVFTGTSSPDMNAWDARTGIQRKFGFGSLGDSSFFGGYLQINDGIGGACGPTRNCAPNTFPDLNIRTEIPAPRSRGGISVSIRPSTRPRCISTRSTSTSRTMLTWSTRILTG